MVEVNKARGRKV